MNRTTLLFKAQLINLLHLNDFHEKDFHKKIRFLMATIGLASMLLLVCVYNLMTALSLTRVNQGELIPAYMLSVSSLAIFLLTIFYSNGVLFTSKDISMLLSLPITNRDILISKFLIIYLLNFFISFVFMAPCGIIWILDTKLGLLSYISYYFTILVAPLIPMCLGSFIGIAIINISAKFKNKNTFSLILSYAILILIGYFTVSNMQSSVDIQNIGAKLSHQLTGIYPLSLLFISSSTHFLNLKITLFISLSIIIFYFFIGLVANKYLIINKHSQLQSAKNSAKQRTRKKAAFISLYQNEYRHFFSSYLVTLNTSLGVMILCFLCLLLLILPSDQVLTYLGISNAGVNLSNFAPLLVSAMLTLSCPCASALSLEGKNIWILQSSPISVKTILNSKIAFNLSLHALGYLLALITFLTHFNLNRLQVISLVFIPIIYSLFISVIGISLNKKFPNFDWDTEMLVVKQSFPVLLSGFIGMISVCLPIILSYSLNLSLISTMWSAAPILLTLTYIIYFKSCQSNIMA